MFLTQIFSFGTLIKMLCSFIDSMWKFSSWCFHGTIADDVSTPLGISRSTFCTPAFRHTHKIWISGPTFDRKWCKRSDERTTLCSRQWKLEENKLLVEVFNISKAKLTITSNNLIADEAQVTKKLMIMGLAVSQTTFLIMAIAQEGFLALAAHKMLTKMTKNS